MLYIVLYHRDSRGDAVPYLSGPFRARETAEQGAVGALASGALRAVVMTADEVAAISRQGYVGGHVERLREQAIKATEANPPNEEAAVRIAASRGDVVAQMALRDMTLERS